MKLPEPFRLYRGRYRRQCARAGRRGGCVSRKEGGKVDDRGAAPKKGDEDIWTRGREGGKVR